MLECSCLPPASPCLDSATSPDDGFENPMTPDDIIAQHKIPPPLSSMILPPIRIPPPPPARNRIIPIHDPTDDIDSDTPIYKSEENSTLDRMAVLGELSHTTPEDLMKQIYSPFLMQPSHEQRILTNEPGTFLKPEENRDEMGKLHGP
ncbi:hypothetical protein BX666DRAFT_263112 [Dichotomocladium elegans]|nr:hypothetical protein BX666DRAFT_263112 [Dichotomocladium elegans]